MILEGGTRMKSLKNIVGILPVLCVIDPSFAALRTTGPAASGRGDSRVGIVTASQAAARRIPTMASGSSVSSGSSTSTSTTTTKSTAEDEADCISDYTDCIKGADACNSDFSECVNTDLFHGKMPQCNSILLRCPASGVQKLFGTTSVTALGQKSGDGFKYPDINSLMDQAIQAGEINNRLDTGSCVKKYMSCLHKDNVCGADFELCTSDTEFKKQRVYCESTLARCQTEGKTELFGSATKLDTPAANSRVRIAITEGGELAAVNAVSTCYKVADNCFLNACAVNPYRCISGVTAEMVAVAEMLADSGAENSNAPMQSKFISTARDLYQRLFAQKPDDQLSWLGFDGTTGNGSDGDLNSTATDKDVSGYIQNVCMDTIGANKFCHMTFNDKNTMPTARELADPDTRFEIFSAAYSDRMKGNSGMQMRINDLKARFDKKAKDACTDTIMKCAMRSCGNGSGSKCYTCSKDNGSIHVNGTNTYGGIKAGCEAIVNTDQNCIYAASTFDTLTPSYDYMYNYSKEDAFSTLFPKYETGSDPMGIVAKLNASLAENYNDAALEKMARSCKATTLSCIQTMCGEDYSNCYRTRTDIVSDAYSTKFADFNNSMNKVNGILDFTVIRGLCNDTVKNAKSCDEYLKTRNADQYSCGGTTTSRGSTETKTPGGWGADISESWNTTAGGYDVSANVESGYCYTETETEVCQKKSMDKGTGVTQKCNSFDDDYCFYDKPYLMTASEYNVALATNTLFQEVLRDVEQKAQSQYNAKLTKEQNKCVNLNKGGVMSANTTTYGDTYAWVKLTGDKPSEYEIKGLDNGNLTTSNDLYGSFCRVRVTLRSDEPAIQEYLKNQGDKVNAYFAVGDAFTCGSWLDGNALNQIAQIAAAKDVCQSLYTKNNNKKEGKRLSDDEIVKKCSEGKLDSNQNMKAWLLAGGAGLLGGGGLGAGLSFGLKENNVFRDGNDGMNPNKGNGQGWKGAAAVSAASAAAGYALTGGTTAAVMKAKNRDKFNEAQRQWMDEIGSHIQCYVGGDEAGSYGDAVQVTLD